MVDWTKPIQFENGERAQLLETWPNGTPNFPEATRIVDRLDHNDITALWWFKEDGRSAMKGYSLVNVPESEKAKMPTERALEARP